MPKASNPTDKLGVMFAVTDHFVVIPIEEVSRRTVGTLIQIETMIACEITSYMECHHDSYFKFIRLNKEGKPVKHGVFTNEEAAVLFAIERAEEEKALRQKEVDSLDEKIIKLKSFYRKD